MDNVGLSTPRGSGTSGYVQRNLAHIRPRNQSTYNPDAEIKEHRPREPNQEILDHERKREVESKVFDLCDKLEDEGVDEDEIDRRCNTLRTQLLAKLSNARPNRGSRRDFKSHEVHEMADAKSRESERMRRALRLGRGPGGPNWNGSNGGGSSLNPGNCWNVEQGVQRDGRDAGRREEDGEGIPRGKGRDDRRYRDRDAPRKIRRSRSPVARVALRSRSRLRSRSLVCVSKQRDRSVPRSSSGSRPRSRTVSRSRLPVRRVVASRSVSRSLSRSRSP